MKPYLLKRFDEDIAIINLTEDGVILNAKLNSANEALAPLHDPKSTDWLKKWWSRRAGAISQGQSKEMTEKEGDGT